VYDWDLHTSAQEWAFWDGLNKFRWATGGSGDEAAALPGAGDAAEGDTPLLTGKTTAKTGGSSFTAQELADYEERQQQEAAAAAAAEAASADQRAADAATDAASNISILPGDTSPKALAAAAAAAAAAKQAAAQLAAAEKAKHLVPPAGKVEVEKTEPAAGDSAENVPEGDPASIIEYEQDGEQQGDAAEAEASSKHGPAPELKFGPQV
jgi:colicin import membrane protein